jgi:D-serine deaminase-like pyridoxal phosphate-dependent protein
VPDYPTPALVVDLDRVTANIRSMAGRAGERGLVLRPHAKTHKSPAIATMQVQAGAVGITVATIGEAEVFTSAGITDLFIAYPLWLDRERAIRLNTLAERATVRFGIDSAEAGAAAARALGGAVESLEVLVEIDSGQHRTGVSPRRAGELAAALERIGLRVAGAFTFPGHSYAPGSRTSAAHDEQTAMQQAAASMTAAGIPPRLLSGGSTPTAVFSDSAVLDEIRPGVYVFNDSQQWELGSCGTADIAAWVSATVVSRTGRRVVTDAGSKAMGADRAEWATGYGRLLDDPAARVVALSEHHATIEFADAAAAPEPGSAVRIVPNHICTTVNLADEYIVVSGTDGHRVVDRWPVAARGRNH